MARQAHALAEISWIFMILFLENVVSIVLKTNLNWFQIFSGWYFDSFFL